MRKITIILVGLLFVGSVALAQKGKVTSALTYLDNGEIEKAWQTIQVAEQNPKTANYYKTYYAKGRILQSIAESKDPKVKNLVDEPLKKAWESYQKAIQLDEKKKVQKTIEIYLPMLNADFINAAVEEFKKQEFKSAMEYFDYALKVGEDPVFNGAIDTSILYNAGLSAYNGKIWNKAIEYLTKAKDMGYGGGAAYVLLKNAYLEKGDTLTGLKVLQEGFQKYPTDKAVIFELINYYLLVEDNSQAAIDYINKAMSQDPENASLYFAKGLALDKLGKHEEAIAAYKLSIEKDPKYLNAYYNLGAMIFNDGVTKFNKCNEIMDNDKFKECVAKADEIFKESLPYLEKAHELDPKEINTLETLKVLYYRLHMYDKRDQIVKELDAIKNASGNDGK
jgi:tetratricopeptide (TPR) repeat protein